MSQIRSVKIERKKVELKDPYKLSFTTLYEFDVIVLHIFLSGEVKYGVGEVTPLTGYTLEKVDDVLAVVNSWIPELINKNCDSVKEFVIEQIARYPCASSLVLSAIDSVRLNALSTDFRMESVPIVYALSSEGADIVGNIERAMSRGYETLKVKIGENMFKDLEILDVLKNSLSSDIKIRFDANQGYSIEQAQIFLSRAERANINIELLEQPLALDQWSKMSQLSKETRIPLMLDESIYGSNDIDKAADVGCKYVKLKLCKHGGIEQVVQLAQHAVKQGLSVVIGNGVSTDIANLLELFVYQSNSKLFSGASESNGFLKIKSPIRYSMLGFREGNAVWQGDVND